MYPLYYCQSVTVIDRSTCLHICQFYNCQPLNVIDRLTGWQVDRLHIYPFYTCQPIYVVDRVDVLHVYTLWGICQPVTIFIKWTLYWWWFMTNILSIYQPVDLSPSLQSGQFIVGDFCPITHQPVDLSPSLHSRQYVTYWGIYMSTCWSVTIFTQWTLCWWWSIANIHIYWFILDVCMNTIILHMYVFIHINKKPVFTWWGIL